MENEIRTDRLFLRAVRVDEAEELFEILKEPALYHFIPREAPASAADIKRRLEHVIRGPSDKSQRWLNFTVRIRESEEVIGLVETSMKDHVADLAYYTAAAHWRRGYAREACLGIIDLLRAKYGIQALEASCDTRNAASISLLFSLGLRIVDTKMNADFFKNSTSHEHVFRRTFSASDGSNA